MERHEKLLGSLCRICTKKISRVSYDSHTPINKGSSIILIEDCFDCQLTHNPAIHPPRFCNSCYLTMGRMRKAKVDGRVYRTALTLHSWTEHQDGNCTTCDMVEVRKTGGRPKSSKNCPSHLTEHIRSVCGPKYRASIPLTKERFLPPSSGLSIED